MPSADYSEDNNIQEPAAKLFVDNLDWRSVYAFNAETFGPASLLGRKDASEVVLVRELDVALAKLNPKLASTSEGRSKLAIARDQLLDADPTKTLLQHNEAKWKLMRDGITLKSPTGNAANDVHVTVIDFKTPQANDFLVVRELWVQSGPFRRRCDLVGFVNGLPLVFIELKRHDKGLKAAYDDNYTDYKDTIPRLFHYNALVIVSNGLDARFGTITSSWDHFYRWKRLNEDDLDPAPKHDEAPLKPILPILLRGMCIKSTLLDIVENFTLFDSSEELTTKVVARNHQYIGVNKAIAKLMSGGAEVLAGKLGVFWHTQGSGKSYSMVFFCQKVHRKVSAAYTFVLLTDRTELDDQIYTTFVGCGVSTNKGDKATGADGLQRLLRDQNRRYVFSLIHKFRKRVTEPWTERRDIIVLSDEAHRTQYGRLATQMRMALRHAGFMAFTGTPLIDGKERNETEKVFGSYVSVYDFQRAVADGATLPLYYENRGEKLRLIDPNLNQRIEERIDAARSDGELTEAQEEKLYRELAREYPVFTSDTHLNDVATDFVEHYHQRWRLMEAPTKPGEATKYGGNAKAMLVCIDKVTCAKMAERIKFKWLGKQLELQGRLQKEDEVFTKAGKPEPAFVTRLRAQIAWMADTQIHPVFSPEQNEVRDFAAEGIDVRPLRGVMANGIGGRAIDECFKDGKHSFRVAVVCAMWLTGFDVKSLATLYLDKPMKGHTLMQAIARVNRVAPNKKNGLIIDYNGMLKSLRKALATYAQGDKGTPGDPLFDEDQALAEYAASIDKVQAHLTNVGYDLNALVRAEEGEETWGQLLNAQNAVSTSPENKKTFQVLAEDVFDRFRGLFPNPGVFKYEPQENAIAALYNLLQKPKPSVDITAIMQEIRGVIDTSLEVATQGQVKYAPSKQYDLSGIDFERLRAEFAKSPYKETALLTLQERIQARLDRMMALNPTRIDLYKRYQEIIAEYNRDKDDVEIQRVFEQLVKVHDALDQEEQRYVREGFKSERELAVYDLLSKDKADITKGDIAKIKKVVEELMRTVQERMSQMGDLRDRASAQAQMKAAIIDRLLEGMPDNFSSDDIEARAEIVFQYVQQQMSSVRLQ
ncbi:MAG: type I restriction endonuclease subunit R [Burkholderiaceae bacterium]